MQRRAAIARTPIAVTRRISIFGIAAQHTPARNEKPNMGVYRNRSAINRAIGRIQLDTGKSVMKKNRMPRLIPGRLFAFHAEAETHPTIKASPSHASQSRTVAKGMELKS